MDRHRGFREFVLARGPALSRTAYLLTGDHHLAEDLVQTALAKMVAHWSRVAARGDPEAYVRRIMVNERTAWWRRKKFAVAAQESVVEQVAAGDLAEQVSHRVTVLAALARLAPRQRAVIVLRFYEDLSVEETADILECSTGTVKSTTADALSRLRVLTAEIRGAC